MNKRPLVICTDPGIDDFIALCMLLNRPEFDILGIVALSGNVGLDVTVNNALVAVELCRRPEIPVFAGSARPLMRPARSAANIHGPSGLGNSVELYSSLRPHEGSAAEFLARMAKKHRGSLELLSLGPLTDAALAVKQEPKLASYFRNITVMGGGIRLGNATRFAEFNILADPEAAAAVFACGAPVTMVGLDATQPCVLPREAVRRLEADTPLGRAVPKMLSDYADTYKRVHNLDGMVIHDAICAVSLYHPEWFELERRCVWVDLTADEHLGQTRADEPDGSGRAPNCAVAVKADCAAVNGCIVDSMELIVHELR
jgi:inosine-uridine nucleoside N-ribohydrolase